MKSTLFAFTLMGLMLLPAADLSAGQIESSFAQFLETMPPDTYVDTIVGMKERVDLQALTSSLLFPVRLPAAERHEIVVSTLQETAASTQASLLKDLERGLADGDVQEYHAFWIANMVAVKAKVSTIKLIALRDDVAAVYADAKVEFMKPVEEKASLTAGRGVEPGIAGTGAPDLWALGFLGQGVIVANIDTGVDGDHPALASRWRGLDPGVTHEEAWFDPVTFTTFPEDFNGHGTHTMGSICGDDGFINQVGMAPLAKWIAAATIDRVSIEQTKKDAVKSFEWCADPDGNAATYDDVPCVVSNSWRISPLYHGVPHGDPYFWDSIDGCEAAGCAVIFAAGNEGSAGGTSIGTPSDRITTPVNVMAIGALEVDQKTRAYFSSMGPSGIDNKTIKPEVMAQGDDVRSATIGGGYGYKSGTSMSCPHVGGAVGLLKSAYPEATPQELKAALLYSAYNLGTPGEDNEYGRGIIRMVEAYNWLGQALVSDTKELALSPKQDKVIFSLHGGAANQGRFYSLLGSVTGSTPGMPLPGGLVLPINQDYFTDLTLIYSNSKFFQGFSGNLDFNGNAEALLYTGRLLNSSLIGTELTFAFCTWPGPGFDFVSNSWTVTIIP